MAIAKAKKPLCLLNWQVYFLQLATKICELEPRLKVTKLFCQWLRGDTAQLTNKLMFIKHKKSSQIQASKTGQSYNDMM